MWNPERFVRWHIQYSVPLSLMLLCAWQSNRSERSNQWLVKEAFPRNAMDIRLRPWSFNSERTAPGVDIYDYPDDARAMKSWWL